MKSDTITSLSGSVTDKLVDPYSKSYYLYGKRTGLSLYENFRWLPELTIPMCKRIVEFLGADANDTFLDFGCARGYSVKALRQLGYEAYGIDISDWAIRNCDFEVRDFVTRGNVPLADFDWILAKDVLEHIPNDDLEHVLKVFGNCATKGVFIVVPLSYEDNTPYVAPEYEKDVTHVQRRTLCSWCDLIHEHVGSRFKIVGRYILDGVKDNWAHYPKANGFITAIRL